MFCQHTHPLSQHPLQFHAQSHPGLASRCTPAVELQPSPEPLTDLTTLLTWTECQQSVVPPAHPRRTLAGAASTALHPDRAPSSSARGSPEARPVACTVTAARTRAHRAGTKLCPAARPPAAALTPGGRAPGLRSARTQPLPVPARARAPAPRSRVPGGAHLAVPGDREGARRSKAPGLGYGGS